MTSSTAARMSGSLIAPHGGELINRTVTGETAWRSPTRRAGCPACTSPRSRPPIST